jgi:hypothetical protein
VLKSFHGQRLIEFDPGQDRAHVSPLGARYVEEKLLKPMGL